MTRVRVGVTIDAPTHKVWDVLRDIPSHVRWMDDALAIRMHGSQREGVGTRFECDTRVGPLQVVDHMEVVGWRPGRELAIRHVGVVSGIGRFVLRARRQRTRFDWFERLRFPWWLGGPIGAWFAAPVLAHVWRRDLHNLKRLVESNGSG